jgi:hypothetical protein
MSKYVPARNGKVRSGYYRLINPHKYKGNPSDVVYRSGWELKFMLYCDLNPGVLRWESEPVKIQYVDFYGKTRNYIPDFLMECINPNNPDLLNKFLIEVKPEKETHEPIIPKGSISANQLKNIEWSYAAWIKNKHKWAYALEWCKKRDYVFKIITEHQINNLKA